MAKKKIKKFKVHGSPVKLSKKLEVRGSPINSLNKKVGKRSMKKKKKNLRIKVASTSPDGPLSKSILVAEETTSTVVSSSSNISYDNEATPSSKEEKESAGRTPGFIFICNGKTKPECYRNRVFGLPRGQLEILEKINTGTKLFLFDFELKLLYGVYKATSKGELGLEPTAFDGKFPAQVRFKIFKECLPLAEKFFKHAIKDNYQGSKFRQDLTSKQVITLVSLFRPITTVPSATTVTTVTDAVTSHTLPAPVTEGSLHLSARLPPPSVSYLPGVCHGHAFVVPGFQSEQVAAHLPYNKHGTDIYMGHFQPPMELRHTVQQAALPSVEPYCLTKAHQPYLPDKPSLSVQDPYGRDRIAGYGSDCRTSQLIRRSEIVQHSENVVDYYSQALHLKRVLHFPLQTHVQRELSYQPFYPVTSSEDIHQAYANPDQRPPVSRKSGLVEASLSISYRHSLAGAAPNHH